MRHRKTANIQREQELLDDVHQTEKEIDLFLEKNKQEAEAVLRNAHEQAEQSRARIATETLEEKDGLRDRFISEAQKEAETILQEGSRTMEEERARLEQIRDSVTKRIMEYLLGSER